MVPLRTLATVVMLFGLTRCAALLVNTPGGTVLYYHLAAQFGPQDFDTGVRNGAIAALPYDLCNPSNQNLTGLIVAIYRGNCTFFRKAVVAQEMGASAAIIASLFGDSRDTGGYGPLALIVMSAPSGVDPNSILIPTVSVSWYTFLAVVSALTPTPVNGSIPQPATLQLNNQGQIYVNDEWLTSQSLKMLTILILVLPAGWLACFLVYWIRGRCRRQIARARRTQVAVSIPLVEYNRSMHASSSSKTSSDKSASNGTIARLPSDKKDMDKSPGTVTTTTPSSTTAALSATTSTASTELKVPTVAAPVLPLPSTASSTSTAPSSGGRRIHNEACAVCLEDFVDGVRIKVLPCDHGFHPACIDPWLNERSELCPICKQSIVTTAAAAAVHAPAAGCCGDGICGCLSRRGGAMSFHRVGDNNV